jgi:hypothetical protein
MLPLFAFSIWTYFVYVFQIRANMTMGDFMDGFRIRKRKFTFSRADRLSIWRALLVSVKLNGWDLNQWRMMSTITEKRWNISISLTQTMVLYLECCNNRRSLWDFDGLKKQNSRGLFLSWLFRTPVIWIRAITPATIIIALMSSTVNLFTSKVR